MPFKCRAAVLEEFNKPLVIKEIELGDLKDGECLVKVAAAGVCHSDLHMIKGDWNILSPLPCILGHEGSGIVEKTGPGVKNVKAGDHCVLLFQNNCGRCAPCQTGRPMLCQGHAQRPMGTLLDGTTRIKYEGKDCHHMAGLACFSEYAVINEEQLLPIAKDVPLDRAALVGCAVMTGVGAAMNTAKVEPGSSVVVIGCGGVGLNVIQGARLLSAGKIIGVDLLDNKLQYAKEFGATHVINAKNVEDVVAEVQKLTGGGADYAFDAIGSGKTLEQIYMMIRPGGTAVEIGIAPLTQTAAINAFMLSMTEKTLKGSFYGSARPGVDMPRLLDLYMQKRLKLDELVSRTYTLDQINEGFDLLKSGSVARGIIKFF